MTSDRTSYQSHFPAPCIVDTGIIVNKRDMRRILCDLGPVRYRYTQGDRCLSEGEGYIVEVFADPDEATLVTNRSLYLNVCSFDYLELAQEMLPRSIFTPESSTQASDGSVGAEFSSLSSSISVPSSHGRDCTCGCSPTEVPAAVSEQPTACFYLVQETTRLQIIPLSDPLQARRDRTMNVVALEAVVADMLSANLDIVDADDDETFPF